MTTAIAPGKIILFSEHAIVYDRPAIAVPVRGSPRRLDPVVVPYLSNALDKIHFLPVEWRPINSKNVMEPKGRLRERITRMEVNFLPSEFFQPLNRLPVKVGLALSGYQAPVVAADPMPLENRKAELKCGSEFPGHVLRTDDWPSKMACFALKDSFLKRFTLVAVKSDYVGPGSVQRDIPLAHRAVQTCCQGLAGPGLVRPLPGRFQQLIRLITVPALARLVVYVPHQNPLVISKRRQYPMDVLSQTCSFVLRYGAVVKLEGEFLAWTMLPAGIMHAGHG